MKGRRPLIVLTFSIAILGALALLSSSVTILSGPPVDEGTSDIAARAMMPRSMGLMSIVATYSDENKPNWLVVVKEDVEQEYTLKIAMTDFDSIRIYEDNVAAIIVDVPNLLRELRVDESYINERLSTTNGIFKIVIDGEGFLLFELKMPRDLNLTDVIDASSGESVVLRREPELGRVIFTAELRYSPTTLILLFELPSPLDELEAKGEATIYSGRLTLRQNCEVEVFSVEADVGEVISVRWSADSRAAYIAIGTEEELKMLRNNYCDVVTALWYTSWREAATGYNGEILFRVPASSDWYVVVMNGKWGCIATCPITFKELEITKVESA